ncbi:hypothetical protein M422DRAFT_23097 [Sphaerobolus stellatus SS14]|nr:hypothetical protein M422DRAFT_23097 [Sphaerobolus stellatus SS14]
MPDTAQLARGSAGLDALLSEKVEFVEGSSTGTLAQQGESKYPYINVPPQEEDSRLSKTKATSSPTKEDISKNALQSRSHENARILYDKPLLTTWAMFRSTSVGFHNGGNTCFMNSALQCLLHTPPLQHILKQHNTPADPCRLSGSFCVACKLSNTMESALGQKRTGPFLPSLMINNLSRIAKHLGRGRQEDAHEFLRYLVDGLQKSCLAGHPPKIDPKIAETSWVHRLFGGRLRSRVTCGSCGHNSDTFDAILDLSLDIMNIGSIKQALSNFVKIDHLRGQNKYKCERCKKLVNAEKQMTVDEAPMCLTVHLKRFTPLGRKLGHPIDYGHTLELQPAMSKGQRGPSYTLYGVVSHAGGGPNSGHYYAHVKGRDGWYEANDESISKTPENSVTGRKNAYILFYMRKQGDALGAAIDLKRGNGNEGKNNKKRKSPGDEDRESADSRPFKKLNTSPVPGKAKEAGKATLPKKPLVSYDSSDKEDEGEVVQRESPPGPPKPVSGELPQSPPAARSSSSVQAAPNVPSGSKRKSPTPSDNDAEETKRRKEKRQSLSGLGAPFKVSNNLHDVRDGSAASAPSGFKPVQHGQRKQQIAGVGFNPNRRLVSGMRKRGI